MMVIEAHLIPTNIIATALIFINLAHCESAKNNVDKQNSRHCRECIIVHWRVAGDGGGAAYRQSLQHSVVMGTQHTPNNCD